MLKTLTRRNDGCRGQLSRVAHHKVNDELHADIGVVHLIHEAIRVVLDGAGNAPMVKVSFLVLSLLILLSSPPHHRRVCVCVCVRV